MLVYIFYKLTNGQNLKKKFFWGVGVGGSGVVAGGGGGGGGGG